MKVSFIQRVPYQGFYYIIHAGYNISIVIAHRERERERERDRQTDRQTDIPVLPFSAAVQSNKAPCSSISPLDSLSFKMSSNRLLSLELMVASAFERGVPDFMSNGTKDGTTDGTVQ